MNSCHVESVLECVGWLVPLHFVRLLRVDGTRTIRVALFRHG
jgi:hypothetical protein